jgi:hypothetical protein
MELEIRRTNDFEVTGSGDSPSWKSAEWQPLVRVGKSNSKYTARSKTLYSDRGIYFLFNCEDKRITCTKTQDFDDLYLEDVVEVFLWPDESRLLYFEYELSPLGMEVPILVPNRDGIFCGWRPWHYEGERLIRKATSVRGGEKKPMAQIEEWTAEFFIPFALMKGLISDIPKPGCRWRANMFRLDYDDGERSHWAWCPDTHTNFHDFRHFGTFVFGK